MFDWSLDVTRKRKEIDSSSPNQIETKELVIDVTTIRGIYTSERGGRCVEDKTQRGREREARLGPPRAPLRITGTINSILSMPAKVCNREGQGSS